MIGESPRYLEAILKFQREEITASELYVIKYEESCKNPSIRLWDRNRPALLLQNTSNQDNFISSFVIDLVEAGFEFGSGDVANDGFNGTGSARSAFRRWCDRDRAIYLGNDHHQAASSTSRASARARPRSSASISIPFQWSTCCIPTIVVSCWCGHRCRCH